MGKCAPHRFAGGIGTVFCEMVEVEDKGLRRRTNGGVTELGLSRPPIRGWRRVRIWPWPISAVAAMLVGGSRVDDGVATRPMQARMMKGSCGWHGHGDGCCDAGQARRWRRRGRNDRAPGHAGDCFLGACLADGSEWRGPTQGSLPDT